MPNKTVWLTRAEVAARAKLSPKTLANWASAGKGPRFFRIGGGRCRYRLDDVIAWEDERFSDGANRAVKH
ncbi:helix-turn-helix transcriptional regulator [Nocardia gipuzkoensis]